MPTDPCKLQFLFSCATVNKSSPKQNNDNLFDDKTDTAAVVFDVNNVHRYTGYVTYQDGHYTGTGDIFAALLVAFYHKYTPTKAVAMTMGVLQDLIIATRQTGGTADASLSARELRVTQNPNGLLEPTTQIDVIEM